MSVGSQDGPQSHSQVSTRGFSRQPRHAPLLLPGWRAACVADDRLYVESCKRIVVTATYSTGPVDEPGTEVVVRVKREEGSERTSALIMTQLSYVPLLEWDATPSLPTTP